MEIQIISDRTNPVLKRRDISLKILNKSTPPRIEIKNKLAAMLNSKPELIVIGHLDSVFGKQELIGAASIYESDDRLKRIAHQHLVARDAPRVPEENAAAEAKPEVKTEEKPEKK